MARNTRQQGHVRKTGNILRTILIWSGIVTLVAAGMTLYFWPGNERVVLYMLITIGVVYGLALLDFDVDDDD